MGLRLELKPGERIILGDAVITNSDRRAELFVEGDVPILREKDILTPATANTPAKRIYLAVQMMYLSGEPDHLILEYSALIADFITAAPSSSSRLAHINDEVKAHKFYKALKRARELIDYETALITQVRHVG